MSEVRPDLSIVVVSWNTRELLERCLTEAFASSPEVSREVIVVDNASGDGSAEMVAERWPQVQLVRNPDNRGYAPACNQGLRAARGRFVMALNSDAFLIGDALGTLVRELERDPMLGAAGPKLLNADGSTQWVCARRAPNFASALCVHTLLPAYLPRFRRWYFDLYPAERYERRGPVAVLSGACFVFRRESLERIGFLDEHLVLNYDDVEWSVRARRAGLQLGYVPEARVTHLGGVSRAFDVEATSAVGFDSVLAFWDLAFGGAAAFALKIVLACSMSLTFFKNAVLSPFKPWRRNKAGYVGRMILRVLQSAVQPVRRAPAR